MKAILINRLKKWFIFALIGCSAYFLGYSWGHRNHPPTTAVTLPEVTPAAK